MKIIPFRRKMIPYSFFHANYYIIGINLLVFMAGMVVSGLFATLALSWTGLQSAHAWWQLVTWFFVEPFSAANIFGFVFNMVALVFFGTQVEREMGSWHYLAFYLGIGFLSGLFGLLCFGLSGNPDWPLFGTTTMIFAVLMVYAAIYPDAVIHLMGIFPLRAPVLLLVMAGIEILLVVTSVGPLYLVHLSGFALAFLFVLIRYRANPFRNLFR